VAWAQERVLQGAPVHSFGGQVGAQVAEVLAGAEAGAWADQADGLARVKAARLGVGPVLELEWRGLKQLPALGKAQKLKWAVLPFFPGKKQGQ
jgi:hypothetical protein